jgi:phosphate transport system permease protein
MIEVKETEKLSDNTNIPMSSFSEIVSKKKFRLSEFLAEKIITSIAFLSIAIIILIFIFVFRETMPIFYSNENKSDQKLISDTTNVTQSKELKTYSENVDSSSLPERYGINYSEGPPEHKTSEKIPDNEQAPERYGLDYTQAPSEHQVTENLPDNEKESAKIESSDKPERYGVTEDIQANTESTTISQAKQNSTEKESTGSEGKVTFMGLFGTEWMPVSDNPRYGLLPLFLGTLKLTLIAILIAAPIGILAAIFTSSFAPRWLKEIVKPAIEVLSGFPSVVIGFFALMVMATFFQDLFGYGSRLNAFVGGVAMSLAAIPIIFTITEDSLSAIPETYKEASLALGASRWQTAFFVTLPAATPGIFAAVLLGIGRVFGETMIALMATGNAALFSMNPFESVRALSATIGAEMAEVVFGDTHYNVLFLIGTLLFIFTFILNIIAEFYVKGKLVKRFQGTKA